MLHKRHTQSSVRSLLWAYGSPGIVTSPDDGRWQTDEWCSWRALELAGILDNENQAAELVAFLGSEKDHRLGARFERLVEYGLTQLPGFEAVHRRLQVFDAGQTLGEFDFIVRDRQLANLEHWEVASKFYLGVPMNHELHWVGPGKRDSLLRKLGHLTRKQLRLSTLSEASETVSGLESPPSKVRALLKGRLFYPLAIKYEHDHRFEYSTSAGSLRLNPRAPIGFWCDLNEYVAAAPIKTYALEKSFWLDPEPSTETTLSMTDLETGLERGPQCVDVVTGDGRSERWFVVAPGWFDDLNVEMLQ